MKFRIIEPGADGEYTEEQLNYIRYFCKTQGIMTGDMPRAFELLAAEALERMGPMEWIMFRSRCRRWLAKELKKDK